jgi:hypothetical protein
MSGATLLSQEKERFVTDFLRPDAAPYQVLAAPPGSGKSFVARKLVQALLAHGGANRILVVVPRAVLRQQYQDLLGSSLPQVTVLAVDRAAYRELEARVHPEENPWPEQLIAVASSDFFDRKDMQKSFRGVTWELIIWDEPANPLPKNHHRLIEHIAHSTNVRRLLVLSSLPVDPALSTLMPGVQVTTWGVDVALPTIQWKIVDYRRGDSEVTLLRELYDLLPTLSPQESGADSDSADLMRRASSSIFALEQALLRFRNALVHEVGIQPEDPILASYLGSRESTQPSEGESPHRHPRTISAAALPALMQLLDHLEEVSDDEKLRALITHLTSQRRAGQGRVIRACIFSSYKDTVSYLQTSLQDAGYVAEALTSSSDNPTAVVERFNRGEDGILLACLWPLRGLELDGMINIIHYDLPASIQELHLRTSRITRSAECPLVMWAFRDASGVLSEEEETFNRIARP